MSNTAEVHAMQKDVEQAMIEVDNYLENGGHPKVARTRIDALVDQYGDRAAVLFADRMEERGSFTKVVEICVENGNDAFFPTPLFLGATPERVAREVAQWMRYREDNDAGKSLGGLMRFLSGVFFMHGDIREDLNGYFEAFRREDVVENLADMFQEVCTDNAIFSLAWNGNFERDGNFKTIPIVCIFQKEATGVLEDSLVEVNITEAEIDDHGLLLLHQIRMRDVNLFLMILSRLVEFAHHD